MKISDNVDLDYVMSTNVELHYLLVMIGRYLLIWIWTMTERLAWLYLQIDNENMQMIWGTILQAPRQ